MKPGMQRDLLAAFWLLFDDFAMDDQTPSAAPTNPGLGSQPPQEAPIDRKNGRN
jgi:hypothetical protein